MERQFDDLPDGCLESIFTALSLRDKCVMLPRVCKRWNKIANESRRIWAELDLSEFPSTTSVSQQPETRRAAVTWFHRRTHAIQHLVLDSTPYCNTLFDLLFYVMPYPSPSLTSITVKHVPHTSNAVPACFFNFLSLCTRLQRLSVSTVEEDYQHMLCHNQLNSVRELQALTSVQLLHARYLSCTLVRFPRELLHMVQLRELDVDAGNWPEDFRGLAGLQVLRIHGLVEWRRVLPPCVTQLAGLQSLLIDWGQLYPPPGSTSVFPHSISVLRSLTRLELGIHDIGDDIHWSAISSLTTLTFLRFDGAFFVGSIPTFMSNLRALRVLSLPFNAIDDVPQWIVTMPRLSILDLTSTTGKDRLKLPSCVVGWCCLHTLLFNSSYQRLWVEVEGGAVDVRVVWDVGGTAVREVHPVASLTPRFEVMCVNAPLPAVEELVTYLKTRVKNGYLEQWLRHACCGTQGC